MFLIPIFKLLFLMSPVSCPVQNPKTNDKHVILGVVWMEATRFRFSNELELIKRLGVSFATIADMCLQREEGKYVLVKDPNKQNLETVRGANGKLRG